MREMSGKDGGWILPLVVYPEDEICITLRIPNEPRYISAFWGALYELTYWNNWQRDPDHTGRLVSAVWKEVWLREIQEYNGEMCPLIDVRQNPENPCTLEKTSDGIVWEPFANIRLCPPTLRQRGNRFEYSTDGTTWYSVPDGDYTPGYNDPPPNPRPPAPVGQDDCCLASANAENAIYLTYAALSPEWPVIPGFEAILGADIANLLHILIGPLYDAFEFGIKLITAFIAGVLFDIGTYTEEVRDELREIICENITLTDLVPSIDFEAVTAAVGGMGGGVWAGINTILAMIGPTGLNLAAATTALEEADCGECGCPAPVWCKLFDFTGGDMHGWEAYRGAFDNGFYNTFNVTVGGQPRVRSQANYFGVMPEGTRFIGAELFVQDLGRPSGAYVNETYFGVDEAGEPPYVDAVWDAAPFTGWWAVDCTPIDRDGSFQLAALVDGQVDHDCEIRYFRVSGTGDLPEGWDELPDC